MTAQDFVERLRAMREFGFPVKFSARENSMFAYITVPEGTLELQFPVEAKEDELTREVTLDIMEVMLRGLEVMEIKPEILEAVMEEVYEQLYYKVHGSKSWQTNEAEPD